jgi:hypothetical protein
VSPDLGEESWVAANSAGRKRNDNPAEAKKRFLEFYAEGRTINDALQLAGRTRTTYETWRRSDAQFAVDADRIRQMRLGAQHVQGEQLSFSDFSERYLGARVFPHMQNVVDLIEGNEPDWRHPGMTYERGETDLLIVNMPPEHAKTTSVTINYVTYRICMDPNVRIILVSKTQDMAKKMLYAVKTRLTHPKYAEMIANYAPVGGFDKNSEAWNQNMIYVSGDARDSGEKDPTVQALGIRGHIYGARADLIIMDDCVDLTNAHEYEKQIDWLQSEVISRISSQGALLVVGTRLASKDLYSELRDNTRYPDEVSPWTYLAMPAVLEFAEDQKDWFTLWPRSNQPEAGARGEDTEPGEDGLFPKWDGPRLAKKRARVSPRAWALVYQQQQVADQGIFSAEALRASINGNRMTGLMPRGMVNCRPDGMDGLICVAGLDPAMAGHTAAVVIGLDPATQRRYVLDIWNKPAMTPDQIRDLIREWTTKYGITEWRVEKNAFQSMLTQDREVREYLAGAGAILREHFTGSNKHDVDFGVASMTTLWAGWEDKRQLIELPSTAISESSKALVEQLLIWHPAAPKTQKTDIVMALWFAELGCRDRVTAMSNYARSHVNNPFVTRFDKAGRATVNLNDAERDRMFVTL